MVVEAVGRERSLDRGVIAIRVWRATLAIADLAISEGAWRANPGGGNARAARVTRLVARALTTTPTATIIPADLLITIGRANLGAGVIWRAEREIVGALAAGSSAAVISALRADRAEGVAIERDACARCEIAKGFGVISAWGAEAAATVEAAFFSLAVWRADSAVGRTHVRSANDDASAANALGACPTFRDDLLSRPRWDAYSVLIDGPGATLEVASTTGEERRKNAGDKYRNDVFHGDVSLQIIWLVVLALSLTSLGYSLSRSQCRSLFALVPRLLLQG